MYFFYFLYFKQNISFNSLVLLFISFNSFNLAIKSSSFITKFLAISTTNSPLKFLFLLIQSCISKSLCSNFFISSYIKSDSFFSLLLHLNIPLFSFIIVNEVCIFSISLFTVYIFLILRYLVATLLTFYYFFFN